MNEPRHYDEQALPWLEPVEDEDGPGGPSARTVLVALLLVALSIGLVAATFFWLGQRDDPADGQPELIAAPSTPYKVAPADPGGLDVAGESETAFATSAGEDTNARLDPDKLTDEQRAGQAAAEAPPADPATPPPAPRPEPEPRPAPAPVATGGASTIQIGAYGSPAKADVAWSLLTQRVPALSRLAKQAVSAEVGGKTVIRLRASGGSGEVAAACAALRAAGESCVPVK